MSDIIWLEKYRPQVLEEVHGNEESLTVLKNIAALGNVPNMILVVSHIILFFIYILIPRVLQVSGRQVQSFV